MQAAPRYPALLRLAGPIILANLAVPLLGLGDTVVIGHVGTATDLGAVALGALVFSFLFWGFGFLRMGTTGFVARRLGAGDGDGLRRDIQRALMVGAALGLLLWLLQQPLLTLATLLLQGSAPVEAGLRDYFVIRIWGGPATLGHYALLGAFIGLARTREVLWLQLVLNGSNLLLDVLFAAGFGWGLRGIALGTVMADWLALGWGLWRLQRLVPDLLRHWPAALRERGVWAPLFQTNGHILLRTLLLLSGFGLFANQGARLGDLVLAGNHLLLQYVSFSAFFLDGFAHLVESLCGQAWGAGRRQMLRTLLWRTSLLAAATAAGLALLLLGTAPWLLAALTSDQTLQAQALQAVPLAALYVLLSWAAFQLDGLFIGCGQTRAMCLGTGLALTGFVAAATLLVPAWDNTGLWLAFCGFVLLRAAALGLWLPALLRSVPART